MIVNQAVNYLTIGIANEFVNAGWKVSLVAGSVHEQGEDLLPEVQIEFINRFSEASTFSKALNWFIALFKSYIKLLFHNGKDEILYISNPPMIYWLSALLKNRFSILIWDVYPDTLKIFNVSEKNPIYRFWAYMNRKLFKKADQIYTIGVKISESLGQYVDCGKISVFNLWSIFGPTEYIPKSHNEFLIKRGQEGKFIVQYSGNIGMTHNVEVLLTVAEKLVEYKDIWIQIIGRGHRAQYIPEQIKIRDLRNIEFLHFQEDEDFAKSLSACDVGVVILDARTSRGSVPSKTYNLMAFAKPILYVSSKESELNEYARLYGNGLCFENTEVSAIVDFIRKLAEDHEYYEDLSLNSKKAARKFTRSNAASFVKVFTENSNI